MSSKKVAVAVLKSVLTFAEESKTAKAVTAFIREMADNVVDLPADEREMLEQLLASDEAAAILTQLNLASQNAALAAAGLGRVEDQVSALREAVQRAQAKVIKFPGPRLVQKISGEGNIVAGHGDIHIGEIDMRRTSKRSKQPVIPGSVATDVNRHNFLKHLAVRYNELKRAEMKGQMKYALIYKAYERHMRCPIAHTPLDRFEEGVQWLQQRIRNTIVGRTQGPKGNRLFVSFEEFVGGRDKPTGTH